MNNIGDKVKILQGPYKDKTGEISTKFSSMLKGDQWLVQVDNIEEETWVGNDDLELIKEETKK